MSQLKKFSDFLNEAKEKIKPFVDKDKLIDVINKSGFKIIKTIGDVESSLHFQAVFAAGDHKIKVYCEFNCHEKDYSFYIDCTDSKDSFTMHFENYSIPNEESLIAIFSEFKENIVKICQTIKNF